MSTYNIVASTNESTVVAEYVREASGVYEYQSEAALERELIRLLTAQGYEKLTIHNEAALVDNLRRQLERVSNQPAFETWKSESKQSNKLHSEKNTAGNRDE